MKDLIKTITDELGVKEISGIKANPQILKYAKEAGFADYKSDETAWCSLFANWVADQTGLERSRSLAARSWLNVGIPIDLSEPGDVVVFWRESRTSWKGHVGFFMDYSQDQTRIYCIGGNQKNQVSLSAYSKDKLLGFRQLRKIDFDKFSKKNIKVGDTGPEVAHLQDALKQLGYNCGTSDGVFGPMTESCLKDFQSTNRALRINGIFDKGTREYLEEILRTS